MKAINKMMIMIVKIIIQQHQMMKAATMQDMALVH